jgi:hypothetical protein
MKKATPPALSARELADTLAIVMPAVVAAGRITTRRQRRVGIQK